MSRVNTQWTGVNSTRPEEGEMAGRAKRAKGRAKESLGALADNKKLKDKGRVDQAEGTARKKTRRAVDKVKDKVD